MRASVIACVVLCLIGLVVSQTSVNQADWYRTTNTGKSTWFGGTNFQNGQCSYQTNPYGNLVFPAAIDITIYGSTIPGASCGMCMLVFGNQSTPQGGSTFADNILPPNNQPTIVWVVDSCGGCNAGNGANPGFDFYSSGSGSFLTRWTAIDCPVDSASGNPNSNVLINYVFQGGANAYYQKLQLVGSRLPVISLTFYNPTWTVSYNSTRTSDNFWEGHVDTSTWSVLNFQIRAFGSNQVLNDSITLQSGGLTPASANGRVQFSQYRPRSSVSGSSASAVAPSASRSSAASASASPAVPSASNSAPVSASNSAPASRSNAASSTGSASTIPGISNSNSPAAASRSNAASSTNSASTIPGISNSNSPAAASASRSNAASSTNTASATTGSSASRSSAPSSSNTASATTGSSASRSDAPSSTNTASPLTSFTSVPSIGPNDSASASPIPVINNCDLSFPATNLTADVLVNSTAQALGLGVDQGVSLLSSSKRIGASVLRVFNLNSAQTSQIQSGAFVQSFNQIAGTNLNVNDVSARFFSSGASSTPGGSAATYSSWIHLLF